MFFRHGSEWACGPFGFSGPAGFLTGLLFWLLIGFIIYQLFSLLSRPMRSRHNNDAALSSLDRRLAEGEISGEEYDEIRRRLFS